MRHTFVLLLLAIPVLPAWGADAPSLGDISRPWEVDAARLIGSEWLDVHTTPGCDQPSVHRLQRSVPEVKLTGEVVTLQVADSAHGAACPPSGLDVEEAGSAEAADEATEEDAEPKLVDQHWVQVETPEGAGWVGLHYVKPHVRHEQALCFFYLYGILGLVFWIGMIYAWRQGDVGWVDRRRRRNLAVMVGGFALYAFVHGFFQFVAPGL